MIKKKIVILGGGYGGIAAAKRLIRLIKPSDPLEIQIIERNSHHTLMTQLHETAGGRTSAQATRISYEEIFKKVKNTELTVIHDTIEKVDFQAKILKSENRTYSFDYLAVATGSRPEFFGVDGAEQCAFKLWSYKEAIVIREHIKDCFCLARGTSSGRERKKLLTFSVAGGGFTGVEMAGELASFVKKLCREYEIPREEVSLYLIEAAPSILNTLPEKLAKKASGYLEKLGVTILCNAGIQKVGFDSFSLNNGKEIEGSLIWSAGIKGNSCLQGSDASTDERIRLETNGYLQSVSYDYVYCVGDAISYTYKDKRLPQVVENALQSGRQAAENIYADFSGKEKKAYAPKFHGSMLSIGPFYGVARAGGISLKWCFGTVLKHLVNLHYHWMIGGVPLTSKYLKWQFADKVEPAVFSQEEGLSKQATQFF